MSDLVSRCVTLVESLNDEHARLAEAMNEPLPGSSYDEPWTVETQRRGPGAVCDVKFFGASLWRSDDGEDLDDDAIEEIREDASALARYAALWIRKDD